MEEVVPLLAVGDVHKDTLYHFDGQSTRDRPSGRRQGDLEPVAHRWIILIAQRNDEVRLPAGWSRFR
jgi:hypothetical protein